MTICLCLCREARLSAGGSGGGPPATGGGTPATGGVEDHQPLVALDLQPPVEDHQPLVADLQLLEVAEEWVVVVVVPAVQCL